MQHWYVGLCAFGPLYARLLLAAFLGQPLNETHGVVNAVVVKLFFASP